jgi:sec-independent protein translocase protein TatA
MHVPGLSGWILILLVALIMFGPKKLPELGRSLGKGIREFKEELSLKSGQETNEKEKE